MASTSTYIPNPLLAAQVMIDPQIRAAIGGLAEAVAEKARSLAPVDTGALRASISAHVGATAEAEITADVPYAAFVEFGTSDTAPQSFLRPALDAFGGRSAT